MDRVSLALRSRLPPFIDVALRRAVKLERGARRAALQPARLHASRAQQRVDVMAGYANGRSFWKRPLHSVRNEGRSLLRILASFLAAFTTAFAARAAPAAATSTAATVAIAARTVAAPAAS
jgi:hypothetical protein